MAVAALYSAMAAKVFGENFYLQVIKGAEQHIPPLHHRASPNLVLCWHGYGRRHHLRTGGHHMHRNNHAMARTKSKACPI